MKARATSDESRIPADPIRAIATRRPQPAARPVRVALVTIFKENTGGGSGMIPHELARHLTERHEVLLLSPGEKTELLRNGDRMNLLTVASAGPDEVFYPALDRATVSRVFGWLDEFRPEVVHAHDPIMLGVLAQRWALTRGVPFVFTLHCVPDRILEYGAGQKSVLRARWLAQPIVHSYLGWFFRNCSGIIALNDAVAQGLSGYDGLPRFFSIPNGRELGNFRGCRIADLTAKTRTLCFIGFLSERKNQMYLLKVLRHLPTGYHLRLVGKALTPDYDKELRAYAARHGLANVEFLGNVDYSAIPSLLEGSHLFVSASRLEVQCLAVIEALASGTPVVGLANETVDELIDDEVGRRLSRETTPAEFAAAVERICSLPAPEYEAMCRRARDRVKEMDWNPVADATAAAYETLVKAAAGGSPGAGARYWSRAENGNSALAKFYANSNLTFSALLYKYHKRREGPAQPQAADR